MTFFRNILRFVSVTVLIAIMISVLGINGSAAQSEEEAITYFTNQYERTLYKDYYAQYEGISEDNNSISAKIPEAVIVSGSGNVLSTNEVDASTGILLGKDLRSVKIPVDVDKEGMYQLKFSYIPEITSDLDIRLSVQIDNNLPFTESGYCTLKRVFSNGEIKQDENGDDITPDTIQKSRLVSQYLMDTSGVYGNYYYYFSVGRHWITLDSNDVPFFLQKLELTNEAESQLSYKEYINNYKNETNDSKGYQEKYQAEDIYETSSSAIYAASERTSVALEPYDFMHSKVNILNGANWILSGDYVSWQFEVPADGFYKFGLKYRQNYLDGLYASRNIKIDGQVPFSEFSAVHFDYSTKWKMLTPGGEDQNLVYLKKGNHTLTLESTIGDFSNTIDVMKSCLSLMNEIYLDIIEITGNDPDTNRDYYLADFIPDLSDRFIECSDMLFKEVKRLTETVKIKGAEIALLEDLAYQLESYAENIDSLTESNRLNTLNTNIKSLSSKAENLSKQGLDLDYFVVSSADKEMPKASPSFLTNLIENAKLFIYSFSSDYTKKINKDTLRVWVSGGQEQLELVRKLTRDKFSNVYDTNVDVQLVSGTLQKAALAGNNPDVALLIPSGTPVNFALRGALKELSSLDGFEEIKSQYREGSFTPYTIDNRVYGIPNTESFEMLFIREDVFAKLNIPLPRTWMDLLDLAPILQRKNMQVGLTVQFADLVFQYGGKYYSDDLTQVCFNENSSVEAFKLLTSFYTDYGFPVSFDFVTRFRTGEMPIGIAPYSEYNKISYSAPEINGLWGMYPLLGHRNNDGSIDGSGVTTPETCSVIFDKTSMAEEAWNYLKWWADSETQTAYALGLESVLGVASRYTTANAISFDELPWSETEKTVLKKQQSTLHTLPILPGTYYVDRCYNNAYRSVINFGENPREMLNKWVVSINEELARKQAEFDKNN